MVIKLHEHQEFMFLEVLTGLRKVSHTRSLVHSSIRIFFGLSKAAVFWNYCKFFFRAEDLNVVMALNIPPERLQMFEETLGPTVEEARNKIKEKIRNMRSTAPVASE